MNKTILSVKSAPVIINASCVFTKTVLSAEINVPTKSSKKGIGLFATIDSEIEVYSNHKVNTVIKKYIRCFDAISQNSFNGVPIIFPRIIEIPINNYLYSLIYIIIMSFNPLEATIEKQEEVRKKQLKKIREFTERITPQYREAIKEKVNDYIKRNSSLFNFMKESYSNIEYDPVSAWYLFLKGLQILHNIEIKDKNKEELLEVYGKDYPDIQLVYSEIIRSRKNKIYYGTDMLEDRMTSMITEQIGYVNLLGFVSIMFDNTEITRETHEVEETDYGDMEREMEMEEAGEK